MSNHVPSQTVLFVALAEEENKEGGMNDIKNGYHCGIIMPSRQASHENSFDGSRPSFNTTRGNLLVPFSTA